ncbi:MAG: LLM class flavin-dependent oxidoreductase [Acidimicrobiales bacterium]
MADRLRFGIFMAPFHPAGENPTLALERDLGLIGHLDRLGWDEAWIGEHHSAGSEIIASPEIFIAAAAQRTRHIQLGTGVVSVSYHNPLWVAERAVLLDHLTRGRFMLGLGPGSLPTDAAMIGLDQGQTRELLSDGVDVIMHLLRSEEPLTFRNERWDLRDARLHLRPYSNPLFDVSVAAVASPAGPQIAGKHGIGLLSIGATQAVGFDALALHWDVVEERAAHFGTTVDRANWRLVGLMHIAETREQAYRDVEYGIEQWFEYFQAVAAFPQMAVGGGNVREMIDFVNDTGLGSIGTVEDAAAQVERLMKQSNGGFGCYMLLAHEWANPPATHRSYELISQHVFPRFQGQSRSTTQARARAKASRPEMAAQHLKAIEEVTAKYHAAVSTVSATPPRSD